MKYYFCEDIPYENTVITEYDSIEELEEEEAYNICRNKNWYIIKGEIIEI